jgi:hypothetical protein
MRTCLALLLLPFAGAAQQPLKTACEKCILPKGVRELNFGELAFLDVEGRYSR